MVPCAAAVPPANQAASQRLLQAAAPLAGRELQGVCLAASATGALSACRLALMLFGGILAAAEVALLVSPLPVGCSQLPAFSVCDTNTQRCHARQSMATISADLSGSLPCCSVLLHSIPVVGPSWRGLAVDCHPAAWLMWLCAQVSKALPPTTKGPLALLQQDG